jgi:hypothetical protein
MRFETRELAGPVFPRALAEHPHGTRECNGNTQGPTHEETRKKSTACPEPASGRIGFEMLRRQLRSTLS